MSLRHLQEKIETFNDSHFLKIELLKNSSETTIPAEIRNQMSADLDTLMIKFSYYTTQIDQCLQLYQDFDNSLKNRSLIQNEKLKNEKHYLEISDSLDNLIDEVKTSMKEVK